MNIRKNVARSKGIRLSIKGDLHKYHELGRVYLYILHNDLHVQPFAFIEDVYVHEKHRREGIGKKLMEEVVALAKEKNCYKIIACSRESREEVHEFYENLGFMNHGFEFRMNLE